MTETQNTEKLAGTLFALVVAVGLVAAISQSTSTGTRAPDVRADALHMQALHLDVRGE